MSENDEMRQRIADNAKQKLTNSFVDAFQKWVVGIAGSLILAALIANGSIVMRNSLDLREIFTIVNRLDKQAKDRYTKTQAKADLTLIRDRVKTLEGKH